MNKKLISAAVSAAALLGAALLVAQGSGATSEAGLFIIIAGAISALLIGGGLRRNK